MLSTRTVYSELSLHPGRRTISADEAFDDCVILSEAAFDPDAVFLDDIVDDTVLPNPDLAVDGLTTAWQGRRGNLELRPEDVAANEPIQPESTQPAIATETPELDVYGWESSLWKKIRGYIGF